MDISALDNKLGIIETEIKHLSSQLEDHTKQDHESFNNLTVALDALGDKLDALIVREAHRSGEEDASSKYARRYAVWAGILATIASTVIGIMLL